ncbi:hypothetical protein GCM10022214_39920 [Actinomadura miaoliensis]|uniref:Uncharacterized protein n=1 Tax=Actinomadura miaoliensis TaxID=430685 RepID=A0ABP7W0L6_9ACTN
MAGGGYMRADALVGAASGTSPSPALRTATADLPGLAAPGQVEVRLLHSGTSQPTA